MKVRTDFVSNSSSCSFVVSEPKKMLDKLHDLLGKGNDCFYADFFNGITAIAFAKEQDKTFLESQEALNDMLISSWGNELQMSMPMSAFAELPDGVLGKLTSVMLECDDYDQNAVMSLSLLRRALCNLGIDADSSDSEHDLLFDCSTGISVFAKIASAAFSSSSTLST